MAFAPHGMMKELLFSPLPTQWGEGRVRGVCFTKPLGTGRFLGRGRSWGEGASKTRGFTFDKFEVRGSSSPGASRDGAMRRAEQERAGTTNFPFLRLRGKAGIGGFHVNLRILWPKVQQVVDRGS
jgi:hypothetical protein